MSNELTDDELLDVLYSLSHELRDGDLTSPVFLRDKSAAAVRDAYEEIKRLRHELATEREDVKILQRNLRRTKEILNELREAYGSAVAKLGSLPPGWQDDVGYRPELLVDARGNLSDDEMMTLTRLLRRFAETELDQWEAWKMPTATGDVYVSISRQPGEAPHYDEVPNAEPTALDRLRAKIDADPERRAHVEQFKEQDEARDGRPPAARRRPDRRRARSPLRPPVGARPLPRRLAWPAAVAAHRGLATSTG